MSSYTLPLGAFAIAAFLGVGSWLNPREVRSTLLGVPDSQEVDMGGLFHRTYVDLPAPGVLQRKLLPLPKDLDNA